MRRENENKNESKELFFPWNLRFKKQSLEKKYQESLIFPFRNLLIISIIILLVGFISTIITYFSNSITLIKPCFFLKLKLIERIVISSLDIWAVFSIVFRKVSKSHLFLSYLYIIISPNFQGINMVFCDENSMNDSLNELRSFLLIISNCIEFYIKLSLIVISNLHHFSILMVFFINCIYGTLFFYVYLENTQMIMAFYSRLLFDLGLAYVSYKTSYDSRIVFLNKHRLIKCKRNKDILEYINCGIVTIQGYNRIKNINSYLQNKFHFEYIKSSKTVKRNDSKLTSTEKILKEEFDIEALNSKRNIYRKNSQPVRNSLDYLKNTLNNLIHNYDDDECIIHTLLTNLTDINKDINKEAYELIQDNKPILFLKQLSISNEFDNFTFIGVKFLENESKEKFFFEVNIRKSNNLIDIIFNDITYKKNVLDTQRELENRTLNLSKLAHEFKNPLLSLSEVSLSIKDKLKLIKDDRPPFNFNSVFSDLLFIKNISDYLMLLVKDIELISLADFKKDLTFFYSKCELVPILDFCKNIMDMRINSLSKNINFDYKQGSNVPDIIFTDETRIKQILLNILSNSLKFTEMGEIKLLVERQEEPEKILEDLSSFTLIFTIIDTGKGISKKILEKIFQPFNKSSSKENQFGSGLGICIVKDMIEKLGGSIDITSDQGTKVVIKIPIDNTKINEKNYLINSRKRREQPFKSVLIRNMSQLNTQEVKYSGYIDQDIFENNGRFIPISSKNVRGNINNNYNINININLSEEKKLDKFISSQNVNNIEFKHNVNLQDPIDEKLLDSVKNLDNNVIIQLSEKSFRNSFEDSSANEEVLTILLVDDEKFTRNATRRIIRNYLDKRDIKYHIIEASDGLEALYILIKTMKIDQENIDLIVSDLNMNPLGGLELAKIISDIEYFKGTHLRFFLLSAGSLTFKPSCVDGFFEKPVNEYCLENMFTEFLC